MLEIKEFWINTISQYMQKPWSIVALIIDFARLKGNSKVGIQATISLLVAPVYNGVIK